jgi:hypothetical protein
VTALPVRTAGHGWSPRGGHAEGVAVQRKAQNPGVKVVLPQINFIGVLRGYVCYLQRHPCPHRRSTWWSPATGGRSRVDRIAGTTVARWVNAVSDLAEKVSTGMTATTVDCPAGG